MKKGAAALVFLLSFLLFNTSAQAQILDSLYAVWQDENEPDSIRTKAYKTYIWDGFLFSNADTAFTLAEKLLDFSEVQSYKGAKVTAYKLMGNSHHLRSNYSKALEYYQQSLMISQEIGDKKASASTINNIGVIYKVQGNSPKALDHYQRSLKISQELGDKNGSANIINNIGIVYQDQGDYPKALEYYQRSLKISEEMEEKRAIAVTLNNIGIIYQNQDKYLNALKYYQRSLKISEEMKDKQAMAGTISNIGIIYRLQGNYFKALEYFQRSLKISQEVGDRRAIAGTFGNIGSIYQKQGDYLKALKYCQIAFTMNKEVGLLDREKRACRCLYDSYKALGKSNEALVYLEKIQVLDDSLNAKETAEKLQQMEFERQILHDSIATAEKERLAREAHEKEVRQEKQTRNWSFAGGLLALLLAGGFYSRWRYVQKSKAALQTEKDRSDNLLLNILPADIAQELKEKGKADARDFEKVSVLFTDFKSFTEQSAKLSAADLVNEINHCFEAFDGIMEKYGIEKIKTIGDSYMAAGGLPLPTDDSVKNTVLAAIEMQTFIVNRKNEVDAQNSSPLERPGGPAFEMRVGIHTGPVVAGIVGVKKFQYDIWGDTVNTASRMESSGEVGKVNISQATYELLKNEIQFTFKSRGKIEAKGKGEMEMYFVSLAK